MTTLTWPKDYTRYTSHVPNDAYRDNWDRIFGKKDKPAEQAETKEESK